MQCPFRIGAGGPIDQANGTGYSDGASGSAMPVSNGRRRPGFRAASSSEVAPYTARMPASPR